MDGSLFFGEGVKVAHPSTPSADLSAEACRGWALFDRLNCPNKYFGVLLYICTSLFSNKINYMVRLSFAMEKKQFEFPTNFPACNTASGAYSNGGSGHSWQILSARKDRIL